MSENSENSRPKVTVGGQSKAFVEGNQTSQEVSPEPSVPDTESSQAPPSLKKTLAQKLQEQFPALSSGLLLFTLAEPDHKYFVWHVLLSDLMGPAATSNNPIPVGCTKVVSVYNGSNKGFEVLKLLTEPTEVPPGVKHEAIHFSTYSGFGWTTTEGNHALHGFLDPAKGGVVIICQECTSADLPDLVLAARQIDNSAKQKEVVVILLLACSDDRYKKVRFSEYCSEYVTVEACEPDVGQDYAFSFDCESYRQLGHLGIPKTMCSVKVDQDRVVYSFDPFISTQFEERLIWMLRAQGKTLEEIGLVLKKNKTTILRRLQSAKGPDVRSVDKAWLTAKLASFFEGDNHA